MRSKNAQCNAMGTIEKLQFISRAIDTVPYPIVLLQEKSEFSVAFLSEENCEETRRKLRSKKIIKAKRLQREGERKRENAFFRPLSQSLIVLPSCNVFPRLYHSRASQFSKCRAVNPNESVKQADYGDE